MSHFQHELFWNTFNIEEGQRGHWRFGPLDLWIGRLSHEWQLKWYYKEDCLDWDFHHDLPCSERNYFSSLKLNHRDEEEVTLSLGEAVKNMSGMRFGMKKTDGFIKIIPALPDRSLVTRPETPLSILPGEEVNLFISVPLWIRIETSSEKLIQEIPIYRPSDTWFGDLLGEGELAYSTKTSARLNLKDVPERYHRAITAVYVKNKGKDNLMIERIKIPVLNLSLFKNKNGLYFTQSLSLERERSGGLGKLKLNQHPHPEAGFCSLIGPPRSSLKENIIVKALTHFL